MMATAQQLPKLAAHFHRSGLKAELRLGDVGRLVEEQKKERSNGRAMDWTSYHDYDEVSGLADCPPISLFSSLLYSYSSFPFLLSSFVPLSHSL